MNLKAFAKGLLLLVIAFAVFVFVGKPMEVWADPQAVTTLSESDLTVSYKQIEWSDDLTTPEVTVTDDIVTGPITIHHYQKGEVSVTRLVDIGDYDVYVTVGAVDTTGSDNKKYLTTPITTHPISL